MQLKNMLISTKPNYQVMISIKKCLAREKKRTDPETHTHILKLRDFKRKNSWSPFILKEIVFFSLRSLFFALFPRTLCTEWIKWFLSCLFSFNFLYNKVSISSSKSIEKNQLRNKNPKVEIKFTINRFYPVQIWIENKSANNNKKKQSTSFTPYANFKCNLN